MLIPRAHSSPPSKMNKEEADNLVNDKPVVPLLSQGSAAQSAIQQAVADLRALRREIAAKPAFKPLSDQEIHQVIHEGRR